MRRRFVTLDVFTNRRFAGNPLAVVLDAERLDTGTMQTIAHEFNHPETVFIFPPSDPTHRARIRIFTPRRELPFAGHPTVGTAVLLAHLDGSNDTRGIVLAEQIGPVACSVRLHGGGGGSASFDIPKLPERLGPDPDLGKLAAALSLAPARVSSRRPPVSSVIVPCAAAAATVRAGPVARSLYNGPAQRCGAGL